MPDRGRGIPGQDRGRRRDHARTCGSTGDSNPALRGRRRVRHGQGLRGNGQRRRLPVLRRRRRAAGHAPGDSGLLDVRYEARQVRHRARGRLAPARHTIMHRPARRNNGMAGQGGHPRGRDGGHCRLRRGGPERPVQPAHATQVQRGGRARTCERSARPGARRAYGEPGRNDGWGWRVASQAGFEPATRCLEGSRSIH